MRLMQKLIVTFLLTLPAALPAQAGRTCQELKPAPVTIQKALQLALLTRDALDASGAEVALIGRMGRDMSKQGLRYSHMALALRDHPHGRWLLTHMLNECGTAVSTLYDEGLGNFFLDDVFEFEAIILIPNRALQAQLLAIAATPLPVALHEHSYSLIAHPYSTRHQNSNQWVLEQIAAAMAPPDAVTHRAQAQRWLRASGYAPTDIRVTPFERIGARFFAANVYFDDHSNDEMRFGRYQAVTVESVIRFVEQAQAAASIQVVRLP
ncbi:MAG TPA: DUF2145 domain-containing protein [Burkholderiales bacterium]|nr:DUF2145 domain-containing protein [Burkholderiales bacterium]